MTNKLTATEKKALVVHYAQRLLGAFGGWRNKADTVQEATRLLALVKSIHEDEF